MDRDAIRKYYEKPNAWGITGVVVGLVVGVILGVFYAWQINPVEWVDAAVYHLRPDLRADYLRMTIESYALNNDALLAMQRYEELGEFKEEALAAVEAEPGPVAPEAILAFRSVVQAGTAPPAEGEAPAEEAPSGGVFSGIFRTFLIAICGLSLLAVAGLVVFYVLRNRGERLADSVATQTIPQVGIQQDATDYTDFEGEPPLIRYLTEYRTGDNLYDNSHHIDSPSGEYLGECGVGISETIGMGEVKKVSALEVWLFDKNDHQTDTKIFMSTLAYNDDETRLRLAKKGEPILADVDSEAVLETQTLRLVVRVVDMEYGNGAMLKSSYFEHLTFEMAVWAKQ